MLFLASRTSKVLKVAKASFYLCIDWFLSTEKVKYQKSDRVWEVMIVNSIMRLSLLHGVLTKWGVSLFKALAAMKGLPLLRERV